MSEKQEQKNEDIREFGQVALNNNRENNRISLLTIIGEIEGHDCLPATTKTTKYEHVLPKLAEMEDNRDTEGILLLLNTVGGDVESGLAIAEMIASISKPTVSLVLGGSHSIGVPIAVSTDYSFIVHTGTMVIHPVHMVETINKTLRMTRTLLQELGREPTPEEVAARLNVPVSRVREVLKISREPVSLDTPIGEEDDSHLGDFIEDDTALSPSDSAAFSMLREELSAALESLTDRERQVIQLRFGLIDGRARTLEEVGKEFNVTRERIRQIEAKALRKLRHPSRSKRLKDFLN